MSDGNEVIHAAIASMENENLDKQKQKVKKAAPKPVNVLWENLQFMEDKQQKFEKEAEKFIPKPKPIKAKKVDPDDEKIDTSFDQESLALYGATLTEELETKD